MAPDGIAKQLGRILEIGEELWVAAPPLAERLRVHRG
jgi:hypothetical protein